MSTYTLDGNVNTHIHKWYNPQQHTRRVRTQHLVYGFVRESTPIHQNMNQSYWNASDEISDISLLYLGIIIPDDIQCNDDNVKLSIVISLENTDKKHLFQISEELDEINDDHFNELINFIRDKFKMDKEIKVFDSSQVHIEDGDDLQAFLMTHNFPNYKKSNLFVQNKSKCCIIMIGTTKSGKSSLIKLLSGNNNVKTSREVESCTKEITLIESVYDNNIYFLDTIGTGDSKRQHSDSQILKMIFKYLYVHDISNIKIIWCIKGDTSVKEAHISQKAEFISNFQINNSKMSSIWNSCIIVKKEGSKTDNIAGVIAAIHYYGATNTDFNEKNSTFGFKCVDWKHYDQIDDINTKKWKKYGYFKANEAKECIEEQLKKIPSFQLSFKREICSKCGLEGDPRSIIQSKCHLKQVLLHTKPISFKHTGKLIRYHFGMIDTQQNIKLKHPDAGYKMSKHSAKLETYHPGEKRIAKGRITVAILSGIAVGAAITGGVIAAPIAGVIAASTVTTSGLAISIACTRTNDKKDGFYWWTCCNEFASSKLTPCSKKWLCCNEDSSVKECTLQDAKEIWSCCGEESRSKGCVIRHVSTIKMFTCCKQPLSSNGCQRKWNCCDQNAKTKGCCLDYPCCKGSKGSIGCRLKCSNCKKRWGIGPGCIKISE